jgi:hypothetical protein
MEVLRRRQLIGNIPARARIKRNTSTAEGRVSWTLEGRIG